MPPHLRSIHPRLCAWEGDRGQMCIKVVQVELRNEYNAIVGSYCNKHGEQALKRALVDWERKVGKES